jgi:hypothetical protein
MTAGMQPVHPDTREPPAALNGSTPELEMTADVPGSHDPAGRWIRVARKTGSTVFGNLSYVEHTRTALS